MTERPIIFTGDSVRAILDGRKTQTRRVVKPQPEHGATWYCGEWVALGYASTTPGMLCPEYPIRCPYGVQGDQLWVRESFYCDVPLDSPDRIEHLYYKADGTCCQQIPECQCATEGKPKWLPSIHMPRWASRLTLEVKAVRVERLHQITAQDCVAEGIEYEQHDGGVEAGDPCDEIRAFHAYELAWDAINGKRAPWESNPWVWVIEFERIQS